jgi:hypothetical protein
MFSRQFVAAPVAIAVAVGGSFLLNGVADAAPSPGSLGTLTFTPADGIDTQIITAHTSAGCNSQSNAARMDVTGPVGATTPTFPPGTVITSTQSNTFSNTGSFDIAIGVSLKDAADVLHTTIRPGEYDFTVVCQDKDLLTEFGNFTGSIKFTDATHWNTGAAPSSSPTPSSSPSPTPSSSPTVSQEPSSSASATPSKSQTSTPATSTTDSAGGVSTSTDSSGGANTSVQTTPLANTGAPVALIFLVALVALAAGLVLVLVMQRRTKGALSNGGDTADPPEDHLLDR